MKDAYKDGINAMSDINDMVAEDMDPTHRIEIKINLEGMQKAIRIKSMPLLSL